MVERADDGPRIAVECDGERYHLDEHGALRVEDIERQAILERAGWRVLRIPYRKWLNDPGAEVIRVLRAIDELNPQDEAADEAESDEPALSDTPVINRTRPTDVPSSVNLAQRQWVNRYQLLIIDALKEGHSAEDDVFYRARDLLGLHRLTRKLRTKLQAETHALADRGFVAVEDGEYFLIGGAREATFSIQSPLPSYRRRGYRSGPRRRWR